VPGGKERAELGIGLSLALMAAAFAFTPCGWAQSQGNYIQPWLCAERRRRKGNLSQSFLHLSLMLSSTASFVVICEDPSSCPPAHGARTGEEKRC